MTTEQLFKAAFPYQDDVLALPVEDLDQASSGTPGPSALPRWNAATARFPRSSCSATAYRSASPSTAATPPNDGAAILVSDIDRARRELEANGLTPANSRMDDHDGKQLRVFFVVAPDGLCYYFHQPVV